MRDPPKRGALRCAIYTRKSSEEGLEQDFNSLHAQREACEAYIKSQKHEGWTLLSAHYDDGGFSGGSMERPALQRLLADIQGKRIDVVVVYKVDRLTRSLADFAKIVDVFDANTVSFVSVTQAFNTTSSMGRLTLNVLLSFAQFEREVTGERIRDKIAASKKKGLWMGGFVPFGYSSKERTLVIHDPEAAIVRKIFSRYLELGSVLKLESELAANGVRTRGFLSAKGTDGGNRPFTRGHLYKLLSSPIYAGKIAHKGKVYDGQHDAIIDPQTFAAVQAQLAGNARHRRGRPRALQTSLFAGLLVDESGRRFTSSHAVKNGKRYRYYVGPRHKDRRKPWGLPAHDIESAVIGELRQFLSDSRRVSDALQPYSLTPARIKEALRTTKGLNEKLATTVPQPDVLAMLVQRIVVSPVCIEIDVRGAALSPHVAEHDPSAIHRLTSSLDLPAGGGSALAIAPGPAPDQYRDPALIKAIARGFSWFEQLAAGSVDTVTTIANAEGITDRYISKLIEFAFIRPAIVERILMGSTSTASFTAGVMPHRESASAGSSTTLSRNKGRPIS